MNGQDLLLPFDSLNTDLRQALRRALAGGGLVLSASALALLGGRDALAAGSAANESDLRILNSALGAETIAVHTILGPTTPDFTLRVPPAFHATLGIHPASDGTFGVKRARA